MARHFELLTGTISVPCLIFISAGVKGLEVLFGQDKQGIIYSLGNLIFSILINFNSLQV
jgi:hypothetical protein